MGAIGILGSLAGGYSDAQHQDKVMQLEREKQQRDLQTALAGKLLSDPSTPAEYKGPLTQFAIESVTGKKLPKFDDLLKNLPAIKNPAFTQAPSAAPQGGPMSLGTPGQTIQLPIPPGTGGAPVPAGAVGPTAGNLSIPGIPVSAPSLPSTPVAMPAPPPPISPAGQFHALSSTEQEQIQSAAQLAHAQEISRATGVPLERVLGFQSKYKPIGYGSGVYNENTGDVVSEPAGKVTARVPYQFADGTSGFVGQMPDGKLTSLDGRDITGGHTVTAGMITQSAPTVKTGTSTYNADTGTTTTTGTSRKDFGLKTPTAPPGASSATAGQPRATATPSGAATPKPGGRIAAMAEDWSQNGIVPGARDRSQVQAYMKANGLNPTSPFDIMAGKDAVAQSKVAFPMVNLLKTQQDYMDGIAKGTSKPTPRADLALIVAAVRAMNPGTVRLPQKELELELKAGSYGDQMARWYDKASTGLLPDDQRQDLFGVVKRETANVAQTAADNWKQTMHGAPLPAHLAPFGVTKPEKPPTGATNTGTGFWSSIPGAQPHQ